MAEEDLTILAQALIDQSFLGNWQFYCLVFALSLVGGFIGSYVKGYAKEKARLKAIEKNIDTINHNLAKTTSTTERIKRDIEDESWRKKDRESLKRQKLESYVIAINRAKHSLHGEMKQAFFDSDHDYDKLAWNEADMLQALYLPELSEAHNEFRKALVNFQFWLASGMQIVAEKKRSGETYATPGEAHMDEYKDLQVAFHAPIIGIMNSARELAEKINS